MGNVTFARRRAAGLCVQCEAKQPPERLGMMYCVPCTQQAAIRQRERAERLRESGRCSKCGKRSPMTGASQCESCAIGQRTRHAARHQRRSEARLCVRCGDKPLPSTTEEGRSPLCERCYLGRVAGNTPRDRKIAPQLLAKLEQQDRRCAYTGEKLVLGVNDSIDHIKPIARFPELRGSVDNIEWTTREVNLAKRDMTKEEFLAFVRRVARFTAESKN